MGSSLLVNELTNLISESKRKNGDLRTAAEKSLQDLKSLPSTSEQQLAADLSRRPAFIEPFLIACETRNARFAATGVTCLQRLVISRGLPKARLQDALDAFNACTDLGLDIQLKVLQALPSLLQNYADDLKGDLLSGALEVCSSLQSAKVQTVSGVAAATLQQLVTSIFEKVTSEDRHASEIPVSDEVPGSDGPIRLRPAAFDAYRVFRDLALAAENRKTKFVQFGSLSQEASLELIYSSINANPHLFVGHPELASTVRSNVIPFATQALSEKLSFPVTVRSLRVLDVILGRYIKYFAADCEVALGLATHLLDADAAPYWKRTLAMETVRNFCSHGNNVIEAYAFYDMADGGKSIVQDMMAAFVRLSAEKPNVIGLGQQSTVPVGPVSKSSDLNQSSVEAAGGVAGVISTALGVAEVSIAGVGSQWSLPRAACLEQLDKNEPPSIPETYIYTLVLECLNSLSDSLAKTVIPLTVQHEKSKARSSESHLHADGESNGRPTSRNVRSQSFRKRAVPVNPLEIEDSAATPRVHIVAALVESCWPAVLATSSTFLNAALDDQYYRNLIKAYQRFAQVAGLLRLTTARDALMTTLGKSAVPPHVLNAAVSERPATPITESPRVLSNPKSLLSVEGIMSPIDRDRRASVDPTRPILTTRNLLCLRALLNLAIALGPTLESAFAVVVDTLRQADTVLSTTTPQQMVRSASQKQTDSPNVVQAFSNEVAAVESAASRLLESTADYSDDAFLNVLNTFCRLLHGKAPSPVPSPRPDHSSPPPTPSLKQRSFSGLTGVSTLAEMQIRDYKFVLPKLGNLAEMNVTRFASGEPSETGWNVLVDELISLASNNASHKDARRAATDVLCKVASEIVAEVTEEEVEMRSAVQRRTLAILLRLIDSIYAEDGELTNADIEIQGHIVDALRAILERSGESLRAGWNRTVAILSSVFERTGHPPERQDDEEAHIDWPHISTDLVAIGLGKTAFAATQLICSDFLSALPQAVIPSLIELLYRFMSQKDDVNMSLTTITMAWNVSDFLLGSLEENELDSISKQVREADDFAEEVNSLSRSCTPAQWLLLLSRLQLVTASSQKEVRKAVFQTLCSIFKNHGGQLTHGTWDLTLRSIILRIAAQDVRLYYDPSQFGEAEDAGRIAPDETMSTTLIQGTSDVMSQHLGLIEQIAQLPSLWETFLTRIEAYLDLERYAISAGVFQALSKVLSRINAGPKIWTGPMYRTLHLWLKRSPASITMEQKESNQYALAAYVEAGTELYRLTHQSMSMSQTRTLVENLYLAIERADGPKYGADVNSLSPLQTKALDLLRSVETDAPSTLVIVAAKLVVLHHETWKETTSSDRPTFVALSSECIDWIQSLVSAHREDPDLWDSQAISNTLHGLRQLIEHKYETALEHKGTALWRKATTAALALSSPILDLSTSPQVDDALRTLIWTEYVHIASAIVKARGLERVSDKYKIYNDQLSDIESFKSLQAVLVPRLGSSALPDELRSLYARSLFDASIVHPTELGDIPDAGQSPLHDIGKIRRGRVKKIPFSQRERMCYECLRQLASLSSKGDGSTESKKLAQAAASFLILRLAIPIRAYIADQPLRGKKPQPLSELEELLFCFDTIKKLVLEPEALAADPVAAGRTGENAHLHFLYPLLVQAVSVAGDSWSGADEVLTPLQEVLSSVSPGP